jgi:hypothetical protein
MKQSFEQFIGKKSLDLATKVWHLGIKQQRKGILIGND